MTATAQRHPQTPENLELLMMARIAANALRFSSVLGADHLRELQQLLFCSPNQQQVAHDIRRSIDLYGLPRIVRCHGSLRVSVGLFHDAQTLFALQDGALRHRVVGAVVSVRHPEDSLTIVHMAVARERLMAQASEEMPLALQLFSEVLKAARQIKGIRKVRVIYGKGRLLEVRVGRTSVNNLADQTSSPSPQPYGLPLRNDPESLRP